MNTGHRTNVFFLENSYDLLRVTPNLLYLRIFLTCVCFRRGEQGIIIQFVIVHKYVRAREHTNTVFCAICYSVHTHSGLGTVFVKTQNQPSDWPWREREKTKQLPFKVINFRLSVWGGPGEQSTPIRIAAGRGGGR